MTIAELVDYIRSSFHLVELAQMERLGEFFRLGSEQSDTAGAGMLHPVSEAFAALREELTAHMEKEEKVLFPWIRSGRGDLARTPIQAMLLEHEETLQLLNRLCDVARRTESAGDRSDLFREVSRGLADLDRHIREHMHLENDILFPRALRGEE